MGKWRDYKVNSLLCLGLSLCDALNRRKSAILYIILAGLSEEIVREYPKVHVPGMADVSKDDKKQSTRSFS